MDTGFQGDTLKHSWELLKAVEFNEQELLENLISRGVDVNVVKHSQRAIDIAWENGNYDAMLLLLKADSFYPNSFSLEQLFDDPDIPDELKMFIKERDELINYIKSNDLISIKNMHSKYPHSKLMNIKNQPALEIAARYGTVSAIYILLDFSIEKSEESSFKEKHKQILNDVNQDGDRLLHIACNSGRLDIVEFLISCEVNINEENGCSKKAVDLAWDLRHFSIVLILLRADSDFPKGFDLAIVPDDQLELKLFVNDRELFHMLIKNGDREKLQQMICLGNRSKLYLNYDNQSAPYIALIERQFEIYALLRSSGVEMKNDHELNLIENYLSDHEKDCLKNAMIPYFSSHNQAHIYYLLSKSRSKTSVSSFIEKVKNYFIQLDSIDEVSKILQVLQYADYLDIVFDFDNEHVKDMNPTASCSTRGTTDYKEGRLYLATKLQEKQLLGTLAHELTHQAMQLIYANDCNPYKLSDQTMEKKFSEIASDIRNNSAIKKAVDERSPSPSFIIASAFLYPEAEQAAELIVRIPHVLSQFDQDGRNWLNEPQNGFILPLLTYYCGEVISSCDNFIKDSFLIKPKNIVKSLNEIYGEIGFINQCRVSFKSCIRFEGFLSNSQKNILVISNKCTNLSLLHIHQSLSKIKLFQDYNSYLILNFNNYLNNTVEIDKAFYIDATVLLILELPFDYDDIQLAKQLVVWSEILKAKKHKKIIFVVHSGKKEQLKKRLSQTNLTGVQYAEPIEGVIYHFNLNHLINDSQNVILRKEVAFQSQKILLEDLIGQDNSFRNLVEGVILLKMIRNEEITIGKERDGFRTFNKDLYVNRFVNRCIYIDQIIIKEKEEGAFNEVLAFSEEEFIELCEVGHDCPVHYLKKVGGKLIWKKSKGTVLNLLKYKIKGHTYNADKSAEFLIYEDDILGVSDLYSVFIISDSAGSGKSTLMTSLSKRFKDKKLWVIQINLNSHSSALDVAFSSKKKKKSPYFSDEEAIDFLLDKLLGLPKELEEPELCFERNLLELNLKQDSRIVLLVDGFDEISPYYTNLVIDLLKGLEGSVGKLFVTTRPHMCEQLETTFESFSLSLNAFSLDEQKLFLTKFWQKRNDKLIDRQRVEIYANFIIDLFTQSIYDESKQFTAIPLQIHMIAEVFEKKFELPELFDDILKNKALNFLKTNFSLEEFYWSTNETDLGAEKLSIIDLYDIFTLKKYCDVYEEEKKMSTLSNLATKKDIKKSYPSFVDEHIQLGLLSVFSKRVFKFLMPSEDINDLEPLNDALKGEERRGFIDLVVDGKPIFVHLTFAEYFVSQLFIKDLKRKQQNPKFQQFLLTNIFVKSESIMIRAFINDHLSYMNVDKKVSKEYGNLFSKLWSSRRITDDEQNTPLHLASVENNHNIARFILNSLEDKRHTKVRDELISIKNREGVFAINYAAENGYIQILELYIKHGANKDSMVESKKKKFGCTVLYSAALAGHGHAVKWLVEKGADINIFLQGSKRYSGFTMFHVAAEQGDIEVAKLLLENGADIDTEVKEHMYYGLTGFHLAAARGNWNFVKWLIIEYNVDINKAVSCGKYQGAQIFPWVLTQHDINEMIWLKEHGADVNSKDIDGGTALHWAVTRCWMEAAEWLLDNGADINAKNNDGDTCLRVVAKKRDIAQIRWLIEHGANIFEKDSDGQTLLYYVDDIEIMNVLIEYIFNGVKSHNHS